jgi:hypothetical protein
VIKFVSDLQQVYDQILFLSVMLFTATFNNISVISVSLLVEETVENHRPAASH